MTDDTLYPALYRAADLAAIRAQRTFFGLVVLQSLILISGAGLNAIGIATAEMAIAITCVFLAGIFVSLFTTTQRFEDTWYRARAVAESVKTSTWRFMMRAEPYGQKETAAAACDDQTLAEFRSLLLRILSEHRQLGQELGGPVATHKQVTEKMCEVRAAPLQERRQYYLEHRIEEQRTWYAMKSAYNIRWNKFWTACFVGLQGVAVVIALLRIRDPGQKFFSIEVLAVMASAVLTWTQVRRFREQSTAYSLAAHEIGVIHAELNAIRTEAEFVAFVKDAESAFSREHIQWVARKDS